MPLLEKKCYLCGTISTKKFPTKAIPVFSEELKLLSKAIGESLEQFHPLDVWVFNRYYYFNGKRIFKITGGNILESPEIQWLVDKKKVSKELTLRNDISYDERVRKCLWANEYPLGVLEQKSLEFIKDIYESFKDKVTYAAVSFSGGKDSTVVSYLVRKALGTNKILHIFADTTLENPDTLKYLRDLEHTENIFLLSAKTEHNYEDLVTKAELPSRIHRWCCTVLKTAPIEKLLRQILESGEKILVFDGIRREESRKRENYRCVESDTKIGPQISIRPILRWTALEEWLFILTRNIHFQEGYKMGLRRIGCSLCPLNSSWSELILQRSYPELMDHFIKTLFNFAEKRRIEVSINDYIGKGQWKTRAGGARRSKDLTRFSQIEKEYDSLQIRLNKPIYYKQLIEYLKPVLVNKNYFISLNKDDYFYILISKNNELKYKLKACDCSSFLTTYNSSYNENLKFYSKLKKQLVKYQFCVQCGGCESICSTQALRIETGKYFVDIDKCVGCNKCIDIADTGCLLADSARVYGKEGVAV